MHTTSEFEKDWKVSKSTSETTFHLKIICHSRVHQFDFSLKNYWIFRRQAKNFVSWIYITVDLICHPVVVVQRSKEWIIKIAIILKRTMPRPTDIRGHRRRAIIWLTTMLPIIMACVQMDMVALNKLQTPKCVSFALKFCNGNCIVLTIRQRPTLRMKHSE